MPSHTRATRDRDETTTATAEPSAANAREDDAQDTLGNSAMADIIRNENSYQGNREFDPNLTGIIHIGMNEHAHAEARALNRANRRYGGTKSIRQRGEQDELRKGARTYKFASEEDCAHFTASLGLKPEQALQAAQIIFGGGKYAKDELAQIVEVYSQAELGERKMDRVVFSGHSVGDSMWGDNNGDIPYDTYADLAQIFPRAAAQVKHLALSACYAGGERNMQRFHEAFPNLESIWAYHGSSPGTWSGAIGHLDSWEDATDEDGDASKVDPELAEGQRKAENVATWNVKDGYQGGEPMALWEVESTLNEQEDVFWRYYRGESTVQNSQQGELRDYYNVIQRYLNHPEASNRVAEMETRRDQTIRLLYWGVINGKFGQGYRAALKGGHEAVGLDEPDWSKIGRADALAHIDAFIAAAGGHSDAARAVEVLRGLKSLDPEVVLTSWV